MKRFRESGEISMRKDQGWKALLNARDHWDLRRYCLRNRHATMMDITTWSLEYLGKSLSLNIVHCCIKKCNLKWYYAKRKPFINFGQKCRRVIWARKTVGKCSLVRREPDHISACFWEKLTLDSTCQRWKMPYRLFPMKPRLYDGMGVHHGMGDHDICEGIYSGSNNFVGFVGLPTYKEWNCV